ncbi:SWIM zinc finger family protein [Geoalkalibacter halelectricus]|uniref:SWIM zinc finger family protein n=1 Tax=Geoalkalibacter halelectricus TaxID=2847045 RepID=UPI003D1ADCCC
MDTIRSILAGLSVDDLKLWAGAKIFSRAKGYVKKVSKLSQTADGELAAWVSGTHRYATVVRLEPDGDFESQCTCPFDWGPCKHAVAVVLAASEHLNQKRPIALLDEQDPLYQALFSGEDLAHEDEDEVWEQDEVDSEEPARFESTAGVAALRKILSGKTREELIDLLVGASARHPQLRDQILEAEQLDKGQIDKLVRSARKLIHNLTDEPAWYDSWRDEGHIPDFGPLRDKLQGLLKKGYGDAVLKLGEELWSRGMQQVAESHDEGDTAQGIAECLEVVVQALPKSSLAPAEQLLWVMDRMLEDDYDLLGGAETFFEKPSFLPEHWQAVAESLERRLQSFPKSTSRERHDSYRRRALVGRLIDAYTRGGARDKVIPLLEREAHSCRNYTQLVDTLLACGEREKAHQWCLGGYARTIEDSPGIASELQQRLRKMAEKDQRHDLAAAYRAQDFFAHPSLRSYEELLKSSQKAGAWTEVREAVLGYLQTGKRPDLQGGKKSAGPWPLPAPEVVPPQGKQKPWPEHFPQLALLIEIAIAEKRIEDLIPLYEQYRKARSWGGWETDKAVAKAVVKSHPQLALDIWLAIAEGLIAQVKPKAYEEAAVYLRLMHKVHASEKRLADWQALITRLRRQHKAKRRLMEVLDGLDGKKLVD